MCSEAVATTKMLVQQPGSNVLDRQQNVCNGQDGDVVSSETQYITR